MTSQPTLSPPSSFSSPIDKLVQSKPCASVNVLSGVEVYKHDLGPGVDGRSSIDETFGKGTIGSTTSSAGRVSGRTQVAKSVVIAFDVSCRARGDFLETRNKHLKLIEVANPILVRKAAEEAELEELVDTVRQMHKELEAYKSEAKVSSWFPAYVEEEFTEDSVIQKTRDVWCGDATGWLNTAEVVDFAMRIARCDDMTVEGVDEVLYDIHARMNALVHERAKNTEEKRGWMNEVAHKIKGYAEVLLDTPCEVQLAVQRASVRATGLHHVNDIQYLASLAPGLSHVAGCNSSCAGSYLPRRAEHEYQSSEPELSVGGSSRSSSPSLSSVPSTPRSSSVGLPEDDRRMSVDEEAAALFKRFEGAPVKRCKQKMGSFGEKKSSKPSRTSGVVVKPAWR
ncbi:hypothetical protein FRC10_008937 [Ceratobasidium sp. 414]|nr:hypothetical protein FRC10_008937 [Ceratobasidium sp. 414]